jgi:signal transduction histidine kinase
VNSKRASCYARLILAAALIWWAPVHAQVEDLTAPTVSALAFDGVQSYVDISAAAGTFGDFTISGWFNIRNKGSQQFLFRITNQEGETRRIQVTENAGTIMADIRPVTGGPVYAVSSKAFRYHAWLHIAFVREGDQLRLYLDGRLAASGTAVTNALVVNRWAFIGANTWRLGPGWGLPGEFFQGQIDEFQIWTVAQSEQEIFSGMAKVVGPAKGLHAYWRFNERRGNRAMDSSPHSFDGRIAHPAWTLPVFAISGVEPQDGAIFARAEDGLHFTVFAGANGVDAGDIRLLVNGRDRTRQLTIQGPDYERYVNFTHLEPDRFYFAEVRVTDREGQLLTKAVSFNTFRPAEYRRHALWIGSGIGGGCLVLASGWVMAGRHRRKRELRTLRSRLARDIHDEIGSNLAGIALLSGAAREIPSGSANQQADWAEVNHIARETIEATREVLWLVAEREEIDFDLLRHLQLTACRMLVGKEIRWETSVDQLPQDWRTDDQRQAFLFFKEAITNIARHSGAARVFLSVRVAQGSLELRITDDGCGFDKHTVRAGIGLNSLRMRARALNGVMNILSEPGKGTTVLLNAPLRRARKPLHTWFGEIVRSRKSRKKDPQNGSRNKPHSHADHLDH